MQAGSRVGRYRVIEQVGAGGMNVVYRARDEELDRDVAIKVLPEHQRANRSARTRFRHEARALALANSPYVEIVFEVINADGLDALVVEFIPGVSLDARMREGPLAESVAIVLATQLAQGLMASHAQGVVHRDLKPANLRITHDGRIKILDFDLAKLLKPPSDDTCATGYDSGGQLMGTLPYMAPERLCGPGRTDARSDVYSAGAVLYEMVTGRPPFTGATAEALKYVILNEVPTSLREHGSSLSPALEAVILRALEKRPARRYQTAAEMRAELASLE